MLHSMTIRLINVHQLETLYLCYGVKGQPGVIWGHMDQRSFSPKMLLLQITWHGYVTHAYIYISLRPSIPFMESRSTWGHIRQQISCDCVQICFQIFFFCQHFIDLYLRHELTDFDQTWSQVPVDHPIYVICPDWGQMSRRGHRCQKGNFH